MTEEFLEKVRHGLVSCGIDLEKLKVENTAFGAAVSGGEDSISLLVSLCFILKQYSIPLKVITINHNIRPKEETEGDALFVEKLCKELSRQGYSVDCSIVELASGKVQQFALENKCGIEAAARELRYFEFEQFVNKNNLSCLCLAHNQNDQLETLLMRFLQGARVEAMAGIPSVRGKYIRPLLNVQRSEIEQFLQENLFQWRTDKTNYDTKYARNKIRQELVPVLDKLYPDWKKNVLAGRERALQDSKIFEKLTGECEVRETSEGYEISRDAFDNQPECIQIRILLKACNRAGENSRIPNAFLMDCISSKNGRKCYGNIEILYKKSVVLVKKAVKLHTEIVFSDIIKEQGSYEFPFGNLEIFPCNNSNYYKCAVNGIAVEKEFLLPVCIRNMQPGDEIKASDASMKKVADILSDWHVEENQKELVPLIQELETDEQNLICILASFLGYKDWIVK